MYWQLLLCLQCLEERSGRATFCWQPFSVLGLSTFWSWNLCFNYSYYLSIVSLLSLLSLIYLSFITLFDLSIFYYSLWSIYLLLLSDLSIFCYSLPRSIYLMLLSLIYLSFIFDNVITFISIFDSVVPPHLGFTGGDPVGIWCVTSAAYIHIYVSTRACNWLPLRML